MIEAVLRDLSSTYTQVGGGGITDIKLVKTDTYSVSIAQEELVDMLTYDLAMQDDGKVVVLKRTEDTRPPGR